MFSADEGISFVIVAEVHVGNNRRASADILRQLFLLAKKNKEHNPKE